MSIQPVPPTTGPTTAGQLAARATQNDQALASWLGDHDTRIDELESRSGTSVFSGMVPTVDDLPSPVGRDGQAWVVIYDGGDESPRMYVSNGSPTWGGPVSIEGAATAAAVAAALDQPLVQAAAGPVIDSRTGTGKRPVGRDELMVNVKDYGAIGDGVADDYQALIDAVAVINTNGGGTLFLPPGTYLLDRHFSAATPTPDVVFANCSGVRVLAEGATIEVKGNFTRNVNSTRAIMPMRFNHCTDIVVEGLTIDGNVDQMANPSNYLEPPSHLLAFYSCRRISVRNVDLHHGSADGLYFTKSGDVACREVTCENVTSRMNARQGLSIIYLRGAQFKSCRFIDTGQSEGSYGRHLPGAGVDIEPNVGEGNGVDVSTGDIVFESCEISGNRGRQFIALYSTRVDNVTLRNCTLHAKGVSTGTVVLTLSVNGGLAENCNIIATDPDQAAVEPSYNIPDAQAVTVIRDCTIIARDRAVSVFAAGKSALFERCRFTLTATSPMANAGRGVFVNSGATTHFSDCDFFFPATLYPAGASGAYNVATFGGGTVRDCRFVTDLAPSGDAHFNCGLNNTRQTTESWFSSSTIRPAANSSHDPNFPFGQGDSAVGSRIWLGRLSNGTGSGVSLGVGTGPPTTGEHKRGAIVFDVTPSAADHIGWVCTVGGTPGTWKPWGTIGA